jgi:hypothetical protein
LKPEWWDSPLVQEEKVPGKTCEKRTRNNNNNKYLSILVRLLGFNDIASPHNLTSQTTIRHKQVAV